MGVGVSEFMAGWMDEQTTKNSILSFLKLPHNVTILQNTSTFTSF
jgi:hypothetical protein